MMLHLGTSPKSSLARRLMVSAGISSIIVLTAIVIALSAVYRTQILTILDDELDRTLTTLERSAATDETGNLLPNQEQLPSDPTYSTPLSGRYWAMVPLEDNGEYGRYLKSESLWDDDIPWPREMVADLIERPGNILRASGVGPNGEPLRMAAEGLFLENRDMPVMLFAAFDRTETDKGARRFVYVLIGVMMAVTAGTLFALWFGIRSALRPLQRIEADIADIREGRQTQLDGQYPSEIRPLSEELNKLMEHNRGVVERARTHVGNLAHALKTPLAVLMNEASGSGPLDDVVRRQAGAMHDNVQHYLKRAQAAARAQTLGARTELSVVLADLTRLLNKLFASRDISVSADPAAGILIRGEKQDLEEMVGNLMENGCKWARSKVHVAVQTKGSDILIHIDDDGDGLADDEREAALKRGVRLDEAAPGTGLGLSIVSELAELHEGKLELSRAPELGGLRASLRLPRA
ncbi:MAG: HAMP domain-containing sensor histidine kinase [Pseudomonadota bacterium]